MYTHRHTVIRLSIRVIVVIILLLVVTTAIRILPLDPQLGLSTVRHVTRHMRGRGWTCQHTYNTNTNINTIIKLIIICKLTILI